MRRALLASILTALVACSRPASNESSSVPSSSAAPASTASAAPARPLIQHVGYGTVMADVARRFELVGKAIQGGRWDLALYEQDEIGELFEGPLAYADRPKEGHPEVLPDQQKNFAEHALPELKDALEKRQAAPATTAFAHVAAACNGCHTMSGHPFIEVPTVPGRPVPLTDPPH